MRLLLSACLLGLSTPYHGNPGTPWENGWQRLIANALSSGVELIPVCPEQLGGLPTPRTPAELQTSALEILAGRGRILTREGANVTMPFTRGARETLLIAQRLHAAGAILKSNSPSCGCGKIYSGRFDGVLVEGDGVTTACLRRGGFTIWESDRFFESWEVCQNFSFLNM